MSSKKQPKTEEKKPLLEQLQKQRQKQVVIIEELKAKYFANVGALEQLDQLIAQLKEGSINV